MPPAATAKKPLTRNARSCLYLELPLTEYQEAWELQLAIVDAKKNGMLEAEVALMLEHPPVYTLGRRGGIENLTVSKSFLEKKQIQVVHVERGGNITYHGPGQIVVYPILNLNHMKLGITDMVSMMEDIMIRTAGDFGVTAGRNPKNRGIWVGNNKLGSIGIAIRKGISFHGFALNVNPTLLHFEWINPCGLTDIGVTSLAKQLGDTLPMADVRNAVKTHMQNVFEFKFQPVTTNFLNRSISKNKHEPETQKTPMA